MLISFKNIILDKNCVDIYNSKVVRSSMSAIFNLNIFVSENLEGDIDFLKNKGFFVKKIPKPEKKKPAHLWKKSLQFCPFVL